MRSSAFSRLTALLSVCAALPLAAQAAGGDDVNALLELLNTPVTTASKFAQSADKAPATVVVITREQILRRNYRSLLDLLQDLPAMKVEYRADPEWQHNFSLRGVPGHDKFVLLMDGVRISAPTNEQLPIMENFPIHHAKQVEVVYGPASALYGADALSGVVNIITRREDEDKGEASVQLGDNQMRMEQLFWRSRLGGNADVTLAGQWFHDGVPDLSKDYPEYHGFQAQRTNQFPLPPPLPPFSMSAAPGSYNPEPSAPVKTTAFYAALHLNDFTFSVFHNSAKTSSGTGYDPNYAIYNEDTFIGQALTVGNAKYSSQVGSFSLESSITASRYDLDPHSNFRNFFTNMARGYKYAESDAFKLEQQVIWAYSANLTLTGGASYESYHAIPWSTDLQSPVDTSASIHGLIRGTPFPADFFPVKYQNIGSYLQAQLQITTGLSATLGARHDSNSRYGETFNPRLGLVWQLGRAGTVKALYGSAFLAPSPFAAYAHFGSFNPPDAQNNTWYSFFWRLPNPDLKPIKAKTTEMSYRGLWGSWGFSAVAYYTRLQDLYSLEANGPEALRLYPTTTYNGATVFLYKGFPVYSVEVRTNHGKQHNLGEDLRVDYLHIFGANKKITAYVMYSHVDGKTTPLDNGPEYDIGGVTPSLLRIGAELVWDRFSFSPRLLVAGTQRLEKLDPATGRRYQLDGYSLLNLAFRYQVVQRVEAFLSVSNALDKRYKNANEYPDDPQVTFFGQPQDLRRISAGAMFRF